MLGLGEVSHNTQVTGSYSDWIPRIANNLNKLKYPIVTAIALANIPGVLAGGAAFKECISRCVELNEGNGWGLLTCPFICAPFFFFGD